MTLTRHERRLTHRTDLSFSLANAISAFIKETVTRFLIIWNNLLPNLFLLMHSEGRRN